MTWTPDTVEALAAALREQGDALFAKLAHRGVPKEAIREYKAASALTWALERLKEAEGEAEAMTDAASKAETERDAANARAQRARVDALDEAEERLRSFAAKKREDWSRDKDVSKVVGSAITQTVDLCADLVNPRALKEAGK